jgi:hypothetical protein
MDMIEVERGLRYLKRASSQQLEEFRIIVG